MQISKIIFGCCCLGAMVILGMMAMAGIFGEVERPLSSKVGKYIIVQEGSYGNPTR
jgi:hypothetical protein